MTYRKKLIEVALPLDAINKASICEKSIRHVHLSRTLQKRVGHPLLLAGRRGVLPGYQARARFLD